MTIRRTPQDFLVDELLEEGFARALHASPAPGGHVVYRLTKTSVTTPEAARAFARRLGVASDHVSYAGLKDKHAVTSQHVSIPIDALAAPPDLISGERGEARLLGYSDAPIDAAAVTGNRFRLVVRGLSAQASEEMARRAELLRADDPSDALLVLNYFGDQRFGSARHGKGWVATRLLAGDFEGALRLAIATPSRLDGGGTRGFTRTASQRWGMWEELARTLPRVPERVAIEALARGRSFADAFSSLPSFLQAMYVEAHQSHLWNEIARRLAQRMLEESAGHGSPRPAMLVTPGLFGEMHFPPAGAVRETWRALAIPTLAPSTTIDPLWAAEAEGVLAEEGLTLKGLRIPTLRRPFYGASPRALFVRASRFELSGAAPDEFARRSASPGSAGLQRTVSFDLPRGAYATVVLRALGQ